MQVLRLKVRSYIPDFKLAFEHFCIHTGEQRLMGRGCPGSGFAAAPGEAESDCCSFLPLGSPEWPTSPRNVPPPFSPAGGRGVIDAIEKQLELLPEHVGPSRETLYRYGNISSSSIWCAWYRWAGCCACLLLGYSWVNNSLAQASCAWHARLACWRWPFLVLPRHLPTHPLDPNPSPQVRAVQH